MCIFTGKPAYLLVPGDNNIITHPSVICGQIFPLPSSCLFTRSKPQPVTTAPQDRDSSVGGCTMAVGQTQCDTASVGPSTLNAFVFRLRK